MRPWIPYALVAAGFAAGLLVSEGARLVARQMATGEVARAAAEKETLRQLAEITASLRRELGSQGDSFPELAGINQCPASDTQIWYLYNCSYLGKAGCKDLGPNPLFLDFRLMSTARYNRDSMTKELSLPNYSWPALGMVGWGSIYYGKEETRSFRSWWMDRILYRHIGMIDELERQAALATLKARRPVPAGIPMP